MQKFDIDPIKKKACPLDAEDFHIFLKELFMSEFQDGAQPDLSILKEIPEITFKELEKALQSIANMRCADNEGIVAEMIKYGSRSRKDCILYNFNHLPDAAERWGLIEGI